MQSCKRGSERTKSSFLVLHTAEGRFLLHNVSDMSYDSYAHKLQLFDAQAAIIADTKVELLYLDYLGDYLPDMYNAPNALEIRISRF